MASEIQAWSAWPKIEVSADRQWSFGTLDGPFPNHDCVALPSPVLDWDRLRAGLRTKCGHTRLTRTLRCAAEIEHWQEHITGFLHVHEQSHSPSSSSSDQGFDASLDSKFEALERILPAAYAECPLGVLVLYIARLMLCNVEMDIQCYLRHNQWVSKELYKTPLTVFMGTEWPIFALLNSYHWEWPGSPANLDYDCERSNRTTLDWPLLLSLLQDNPNRPEASWWMDSLRFTFDNKLAHDLYTSSSECLYGVYVTNIVKAMWTADTESSAWRTYAPYVQWVFYESLHLLGASKWRLFAILHHFTSLRRHTFRLDFTAKELGGLPWREQGEWLQALPPARHLGLLELASPESWRPQFREADAALRSALANAMQTPDAQGGGLQVVYVTMVYGRMNRYIESWAARCRLLGVTNLVMATLDAEAYALCTEHHGQQCVRGGISALNKYTLLLIALQMGIDVMWLDFDVFLVRHPGAALAAAVSPGYDLLMGYDFESDCLCNGFFYIRSRPSTVNWLFQLLRWLYDHPFEHDQRAIGAFLNYTEKVAATPEEMPAVPRWHVFDVDSTFINFGSWLGGYEELVLVHFVDGSAFSLYGRSDSDPSIPESKLKGMRAFAEGADQEESPMDAFYRPGVAALPAEELWEVQPHLKLLLDGKRKPKPLQRQACGILPSVETASTGYGWLAEHGAKAVPPEMQ